MFPVIIIIIEKTIVTREGTREFETQDRYRLSILSLTSMKFYLEIFS